MTERTELPPVLTRSERIEVAVSPPELECIEIAVQQSSEFDSIEQAVRALPMLIKFREQDFAAAFENWLGDNGQLREAISDLHRWTKAVTATSSAKEAQQVVRQMKREQKAIGRA